jgi:DNA-binding protein HU-beta
MKKSELVAKVADDAGISLAAAEKAVDAFTEVVASTLKRDGKIALGGFGTFSISTRKGRRGKNPATGRLWKFPAQTVATFIPSRALSQRIRPDR